MWSLDLFLQDRSCFGFFFFFFWLQQLNYTHEKCYYFTPTLHFLVVMVCSFPLACINTVKYNFLPDCHLLSFAIVQIKLPLALSVAFQPVWEGARPDLQPYNPSALVLHSLQTKHTLITVAASARGALPPHKFINTRHCTIQNEKQRTLTINSALTPLVYN